MDWRYCLRNVSCSEPMYNIWAMKYLFKARRYVYNPMRQVGSNTKTTTPTTAKGCRSFAGMVNFLSMFCPELQKLLKPIYDLTRKGRPFIWEKEQQDSFGEIKHRLIKPPVLHMPNKTGRFHCTLTPVNLQLVAHCIKYRMVSQN